MKNWPNYPTIYEINTWTWLDGLSRAAGAAVALADVPQAELERIAAFGFDGLWLMGVWQRSPAGRRIAREHPDLQAGYRAALPDFSAEDVAGSPYAILDYTVDPGLGGDAGLAALRERLRALGLGLILDFVPNHLAVDHPWLKEHPERLVQGDQESLIREPDNYFRAKTGDESRVFAHGRDPYFAGWSDTVQLDYRRPVTRQAMRDILLSIAGRCDGVRCDMAMLVDQGVFRRSWGGQFEPPRAEFWPCAIGDAKAQHPGFLTLAEVYWDMEWELQQQGFDYTYDKRFYDRLREGDAMAVRLHLNADLDYQAHLARFIENHDEPRAAEAFGLARSRAAAVTALTLPGLRLVHEGQMQGWRRKLPVQLGRRAVEEAAPGLADFYKWLLNALRHPVFHAGQWRLLHPQPANQQCTGCRSVVAHAWTLDDARRIVIANLSAEPIQSLLPLEAPELAGRTWTLDDLLDGQRYLRSGDEMVYRGLYVDLPAYGYHLFELRAV